MFRALIYLIFLVITSCTSIKPVTRASDGVNSSAAAKNIIFFIVDGMGPEYIKAARIFNQSKPFNYESFTCKTMVSTCSQGGVDEFGRCNEQSLEVTDSAAAATAMATGTKVKNAVISQDISGDGRDLKTILEILKQEGKSTGIVATKLFTDATPAAFVSHAHDRDLTEEILHDIFIESKPNVVFGADTELHRLYAKKSKDPYRRVYTAADLRSLSKEMLTAASCRPGSCPYVYGGFGLHQLVPEVYQEQAGLPLEITSALQFVRLGVPHLSEMTEAALNILSKNDRGFFLMVESSMPDIIGHHHFNIDATAKAPKAIEMLVREMLEVNQTVKVIEAFLAHHPDTLVVLTADHETGGLVVLENETDCLGQDRCVPKVRWTSERYDDAKDSLAQHTSVDVPLFATGAGADRFCRERIDNTDIPKLALLR